MTEKTEALLQQLSDKLGTTAEHLWGVLVRQAPIDGWVTIAADVAFLYLACFLWVRFVGMMKRSAKKMEENGRVSDSQEFAEMGLFMFNIVFTVVVVICVIFNFSEALAGIVNPEYWALKQLIN